jgi:hypothetical protein
MPRYKCREDTAMSQLAYNTIASQFLDEIMYGCPIILLTESAMKCKIALEAIYL